LITYLLDARIDGEPLSDDSMVGTLRLLLLAGIDTTWSAIGACLWHLANHADDRKRLVADPQLIPTAIEEFLRAYAPVTVGRRVVKETQIGGCPFREGEMTLLSFPAANRDPSVFPSLIVSSSTALRIAISRSASAFTAVSARTWRAWK